MPTYEYVCKSCSEQFEVFQSFSDKPLKKHQCGGDLQKVFHARGIVFKGSGFYATDSKTSSLSKPSTPSESTSSPESKPKAKAGSSSSSADD